MADDTPETVTSGGPETFPRRVTAGPAIRQRQTARIIPPRGPLPNLETLLRKVSCGDIPHPCGDILKPSGAAPRQEVRPPARQESGPRGGTIEKDCTMNKSRTRTIPSSDAKFNIFFRNFINYIKDQTVGANPRWPHIPQGETGKLDDAYNCWSAAYTQAKGPQWSFRGAKTLPDPRRGAGEGRQGNEPRGRRRCFSGGGANFIPAAGSNRYRPCRSVPEDTPRLPPGGRPCRNP